MEKLQGGDPAEAGERSVDNVAYPARVGDRVRVRRQRWSIVAAQQYDTCQLLRVSGLGAQNAGVMRSFVLPFEDLEPLEPQRHPRVVSLRRWRRVCRSVLTGHGSAGSLRAAGRAQMDLLPHQLEPALALLRGAGTRLLLADDVGLGKTIQAGLAIAELSHSGAAERVLVLTPAGLREQWAAELTERFRLVPAILDMADTRRRAAMLAVGLNPWSTVPLAVASIDYVKRPEVLPAVLACQWDVVVVDEAHGVAIGSDRHNAAAAICRLAPYVLLLTATPHSGDHRAFVSLCGLGRSGRDPLIVFRRTRHEVAVGAGRRVHKVMVRPTPEERRMYDLLAGFSRAVRTTRVDRDAWLALTILHKRAFSSAHSLEQTVLRRLSVLESPGQLTEQLLLPIDPTGDLDSADEPPLVYTPLFADVGLERKLLLRLAHAAGAATIRETKIRTLVRLLRRLKRLGEAAIVFTEYRDTLFHIEKALPAACAVLHGGLTRGERRAALDDFASGRRSILLATDAAGEGLNLQSRCRVVINLELPWNPMRLEQRIGRVDRIGQHRTVHAFHLVALDTGEVRILERLRARLAQARADVGAADPLERPHSSGESEDDATAHLVMSTGIPEDTEPMPTASENKLLLSITLSKEAAAEQARLAVQRSRAAAGGDDEAAADPRGTVLVVTRRPVMRALLGRRALVLMQTVCEDACGREVATHVTPLLVRLDWDAASGLSRTFGNLVNTLEALALKDLDPGLREWESETLRLHRHFWTTRLIRERANAEFLLARGGRLFQPGLFDRRADRSRGAASLVEDELREELARRIKMVELAAKAAIRPSRAVLAMVRRRS